VHPSSDGQIVQLELTATPAVPGLIDGVRSGRSS
jgi:hypothetical protein